MGYEESREPMFFKTRRRVRELEGQVALLTHKVNCLRGEHTWAANSSYLGSKYIACRHCYVVYKDPMTEGRSTK